MRSLILTALAAAALSCAHGATTTNPATPAAGAQAGMTRERAQAIVEKSAPFQELLKEHPRLGLMADDGDDRLAGEFDFRAYFENDAGETFTAARFRVDFPHKSVARYLPDADTYEPIEGTAALFDR
ncbi:MAG TPA: hypothetical protein VFP84_25575 [Kofleriaceae bacterium]|nr:hypothetical protein [Kofleriaceae bacterium]